MKKSHVLLIAILLGVGACAKEETVKPDSAPADASKGAETSGVDQKGAQGTVTDDGGKSGPSTASGGDVATDAKRRVHFAYDSDNVDDANRAIVEANAAYLSANPKMKVTLEGHTDERGTREYNLALGERRANSVARMLRVLGVPDARVSTSSYGEEKPLAAEQNDSAWQQNRRVEFIYK